MKFFTVFVFAALALASCRSGSGIGGRYIDSTTVYRSPVLEYKVEGKDSMALVIPGPQYRARFMKRALKGSHYRETWITPIWVPVMNLSSLHGGFTPIKKGGNKQSLVLNVMDSSGEVFTIRSIQKNPVKALPLNMRNTMIINVARDQVSSLHPMGAFMVPKMADALGLIHTNPELYYISSDPGFKNFRHEFAGRLVMIEQKFEGNVSLPGFDKPVKVYKTEEAIEELRKDPLLRVDQEMVLRARYLDMIIGDWDRSEDQWKWVLKEENGKRTLLPVPRDRDQAFVKMDGFFPWLYNRKFVTRKYQGFGEEIDDVIGLNWNARTFDRRFLNELDRDDWMRIVADVQRSLNDKVIENAVNSLPKAYQDIDGEEIKKKLRSRRDGLAGAAFQYYKIVADDISIAGSDKNDVFVVHRYPEDSVRLTVTHQGVQVYSRTALTRETNEFILYGNDGPDVFKVTGSSNDGLLVRIIGGGGKDSIIDSSRVSGIQKFTKVYDLKDETVIISSDETKNHTSYDVRVNENSMDVFEYDSYTPRLIVNYNIDQGINLGAGFSYTHEDFRKKPYAFKHQFDYGQSISNNSFFIFTNSDFVQLLGKWGLKVKTFLYPQFITSFYGFGNETMKGDLSDDFYKLRMNRTHISPMLYRNLNDRLVIGFGTEYSRHTAFPDRFKYITNFIGNKKLHQEFASLKFEYLFRKLDKERTSLQWKNYAVWKFGLTENTKSFSRIGTEGIIYHPLKVFLSPVIAIRVGAATNFDRFPFYESNFLGGYNFENENETLRGFRRNRFAGKTIAYNNNELRLKLLKFGNYGEAGAFGFYDLGRVWMERDPSDILHTGKGFGVWIKPIRSVILTVTSAHSEEENLVNVDMGFFF